MGPQSKKVLRGYELARFCWGLVSAYDLERVGCHWPPSFPQIVLRCRCMLFSLLLFLVDSEPVWEQIVSQRRAGAAGAFLALQATNSWVQPLRLPTFNFFGGSCRLTSWAFDLAEHACYLIPPAKGRMRRGFSLRKSMCPAFWVPSESPFWRPLLFPKPFLLRVHMQVIFWEPLLECSTQHPRGVAAWPFWCEASTSPP